MATIPGGSRRGAAAYWTVYAVAQLVRLPWSVRLHGGARIGPGPAILAGNHLRALDPVFLGISLPRRIAFITKAEAFRGPLGPLLRRTGQIALMRGDRDSTASSLASAAAAIENGRTVVVYPEATRSPDGLSLHRLHHRVLDDLVRDSPTTPVHAVAITYDRRPWRRTRVTLHVSAPLDPGAAPSHNAGPNAGPARPGAPALVDVVRDALLALGRMPYVDRFGTAVKAERRRGGRP